jgi:hypothetical protein
MAKKKESTAKKVGRFVTDELLGIDDAKRAYKKARKGDIKGALKSAATGAFELGTTATAFGKGGMLATKAGSKMVSKKTVEKASTKIGQKAGQKAAERLPAPKYPSAKGKEFNIKTQGKSTTTSRSGGKSTAPDSARVKGTKKPLTENQRLGSFKAQTKTRDKAIVSTAAEGRSVSKPVIKKVTGDTAVKFAARGVVAQKGISEYNKNKKKSK